MKKYKLITIHEESLSENETLCVFLNVNNYDDNDKESVIGIYDKSTEIYLFFNTIKELIDYRYYSVRVMQRAYYKEELFDEYYDNGSDKLLSNILEYLKS